MDLLGQRPARRPGADTARPATAGRESRPDPSLDLVGTALASGGLFGIVYALVRGNAAGWTSTPVLGGFIAGTALLVGFVLYELRAKHPMLPMRLFRHRSFSAINAANLLMFLGMFGAIFLLSQYLQPSAATHRWRPACGCCPAPPCP